jgi:hypothetical protein
MISNTISTAGLNQSLLLAVFTQTLVKYISHTSEKHADKVLDSVSGMHKFPSVPTITTMLWKAVQKFDVARLVLSSDEGNVSYQDEWEH